ncbi:MAG: nucleotidyltransferase family protein [Porticoccaceae bacterium]
MAKPLAQTHIVRFLKDPKVASSLFTAKDWELLLRQARRTNLLSRIAFLIDKSKLIDQVPEPLGHQLNGATIIADSNLQSVHREVSKIYAALSEIKSPFVLLKGAAYVASRKNTAHGRLFSDVDIMVKKELLGVSEKALYRHGWITSKIDPYDQKYYRKWMHELPPMRNLKRRSELDVHHTIIPPTARLKPDVQKIWGASEPVPDYPGLFVLSPCDMVLHSATHLFHEGEFHQGLRDLSDLDSLLREHSDNDPDFWQRLPERAKELNLSRPLYYGLRYCRILFDTPIPDQCYQEISVAGAPSRLGILAMDWLLMKAMTPTCIHHPNRFVGIPNFILYVRSHYLRMPPNLLIPHLIRKAFKPE